MLNLYGFLVVVVGGGVVQDFSFFICIMVLLQYFFKIEKLFCIFFCKSVYSCEIYLKCICRNYYYIKLIN